MPDWVADLLQQITNSNSVNSGAGAASAVPEIDAASGAIAIAAVIAALLLVRALRDRAAI